MRSRASASCGRMSRNPLGVPAITMLPFSARERLVLLPYGAVYFSTLKCLCKLRQQIGMKRDATAFAGSDG